jgi:hypothetical protein
MSDAAETTHLSVEDVMKLVSSARSGTADPVSASIVIFQSLGESAILSGDIMRLALSQASLSFEGPITDVVAAVVSIAKTGNLITFTTNDQELRTVLHGTPLRLKQTVTFEVGSDGGNPYLGSITGVAVHKVFWIDIQQIQLRQQDGKKIVHVVTAHGTRDFPLF